MTLPIVIAFMVWTHSELKDSRQRRGEGSCEAIFGLVRAFLYNLFLEISPAIPRRPSLSGACDAPTRKKLFLTPNQRKLRLGIANGRLFSLREAACTDSNNESRSSSEHGPIEQLPTIEASLCTVSSSSHTW